MTLRDLKTRLEKFRAITGSKFQSELSDKEKVRTLEKCKDMIRTAQDGTEDPVFDVLTKASNNITKAIMKLKYKQYRI